MMMTETHDAEELFEGFVTRFLADPTVTEGTGFGSNAGLRVGGKIFAMLVRGDLVVKLSKDRVDQLVASRIGARFDLGRGRPMKEWVAIPARQSRDWDQLVDEALRFVRSIVEPGR